MLRRLNDGMASSDSWDVAPRGVVRGYEMLRRPRRVRRLRRTEEYNVWTGDERTSMRTLRYTRGSVA